MYNNSNLDLKLTNTEKNTKIDNNEPTPSLKSQKFSDFMVNWLIKNLKLCGIRLIYCLFSSKKLLKKGLFKFIDKIKNEIFSTSTLRFTLGITIIPFLNKVFLILKDYLQIKIDSNIFEAFSMFISSFLCSTIIENSAFTNYILISIIFRVIHNYISKYLSNKNILQTETKVYSYIIIAIPCVIWMLLMDYHPSYLALVKPTDTYSNFTKEEVLEMNFIRNKKRLV
jgi:hypothetical protein